MSNNTPKRPTKTPSKLDQMKAQLISRLAKSPALPKSPSLARAPR